MRTIESYWPLFDLRLRTPRLGLRLPTDGDLNRLAQLVERGIHDPRIMPFDDPPWTDTPSPRREREFVQRHWRARALWEPSDWRLRLMADFEGAPIGVQDIMATNFAAVRTVTTYSWIGLEFQGRGFGREMRAAVLDLAFEGLGARAAHSEAFDDNAASIAVSRALGYEENGHDWMLRRGVASASTRFLLTRETWVRLAASETRVDGLAACLPLFGLAGSRETVSQAPDGETPTVR